MTAFLDSDLELLRKGHLSTMERIPKLQCTTHFVALDPLHRDSCCLSRKKREVLDFIILFILNGGGHIELLLYSMIMDDIFNETHTAVNHWSRLNAFSSVI